MRVVGLININAKKCKLVAIYESGLCMQEWLRYENEASSYFLKIYF